MIVSFVSWIWYASHLPTCFPHHRFQNLCWKNLCHTSYGVDSHWICKGMCTQRIFSMEWMQIQRRIHVQFHADYRCFTLALLWNEKSKGQFWCRIIFQCGFPNHAVFSKEWSCQFLMLKLRQKFIWQPQDGLARWNRANPCRIRRQKLFLVAPQFFLDQLPCHMHIPLECFFAWISMWKACTFWRGIHMLFVPKFTGWTGPKN